MRRWEGAEIALEALGDARRDLGDLLTRFTSQRQDFAADPKTMLSLGSEGTPSDYVPTSWAADHGTAA